MPRRLSCAVPSSRLLPLSESSSRPTALRSPFAGLRIRSGRMIVAARTSDTTVVAPIGNRPLSVDREPAYCHQFRIPTQRQDGIHTWPTIHLCEEAIVPAASSRTAMVAGAPFRRRTSLVSRTNMPRRSSNAESMAGMRSKKAGSIDPDMKFYSKARRN